MMKQPLLLPCDVNDTPFFKDVSDLGNRVFEHAALNNRFYDTWRSRCLTAEEFEIFSINYFYRVRATVARISTALTTIDDWESRIQLFHNLSDELGSGDKGKVHIQLLFQNLNAICLKLCEKSFKELYDDCEPLEETRLFISRTNELCGTGPLEAAGAILAQEWHGYTQIAYLLDGFSNYKNMFEFQEYHELAEYFYVHLGSAEKDHIKQASTIAARLCRNNEDFNHIEGAFYTYLDLLSDFWAAIFNKWN